MQGEDANEILQMMSTLSSTISLYNGAIKLDLQAVKCLGEAEAKQINFDSLFSFFLDTISRPCLPNLLLGWPWTYLGMYSIRVDC